MSTIIQTATRTMMMILAINSDILWVLNFVNLFNSWKIVQSYSFNMEIDNAILFTHFEYRFTHNKKVTSKLFYVKVSGTWTVMYTYIIYFENFQFFFFLLKLNEDYLWIKWTFDSFDPFLRMQISIFFVLFEWLFLLFVLFISPLN